MKNKNSGFSLFTVLIAVSFLSIMGLLLLYITVANFQMQTTDLKGKDSFYTAEQALEEIRIGLQQDVGEAMSSAYLSVMESYSEESSTDETLEEKRQTSFKQKYLKILASRLSGNGNGSEADGSQDDDGITDVTEDDSSSATETKTYSLSYLIDYVDLLSTEDTSVFDKDKESLVITNPTGTEPVMEVGMESGVLLKNLKVIYVDEKGRASIIQTDIRLGIPKIQFPTPSTLPDLMNMIVVADGGIQVGSDSDGGSADQSNMVTIEGSVYAGTMKDSDGEDTGVSIQVAKNQILKISGGDEMVCEGEINVSDYAAFTAASDVTLWASGITLSQATVDLLGKSYIADDLTVENGSGSTVTISGEYYGFGSPDSAKASYNNYAVDSYGNYFQASDHEDDGVTQSGNLFDDRSDASLSSAIVINGKNTTLDLSGLTKLMLAGRNYVGTSQVSSGSESKNGDVLMGESLTVKGTQLAYLLPSSLLTGQAEGYTAALTNPMTYEQYEESGLMAASAIGTSAIVDSSVKLSEWGGKSLAEIGVDADSPVKTVFYNDNNVNSGGGGYVYFYLNFTEENKAAAFMQSYYLGNSEIKEKLDSYLSFYFPNSSETNYGIQLTDTNTYLRYVNGGNYITSGNVFSYNSETGTGSLQQGSDDGTDTGVYQDQVGYQNMWYALNRKMIGSYDLLNQEVKDTDGNVDHNETLPTQSVFDNLVNEKDMVEFAETHDLDDQTSDHSYLFTSSVEDGSLQAIFSNNGSGSVTVPGEDGAEDKTYQGSGEALVITSEKAEKLRLVVCTGDVVIEENVTFQGIIMAKGKITLKAGASLSSTPLEAAKVFQAQMANLGTEEETLSPKDFFWDGDSYVLGSSSDSDDSGSGSGSRSDTYDISQSITYENWKKM